MSAYGVAFIKGLQYGGGDGGSVGEPDGDYLLAGATAKHWLAYDLEGYEPRTDVQPRPETAACDGAGGYDFDGCQRWNFDASPPRCCKARI